MKVRSSFLLACPLSIALALPAWANMSDAEFLELCSTGSAPRLEIAIEEGANVEARDAQGMTPLMRVARDNFQPVVLHVLLNAGADTDARDAGGKRAVDYIRMNDRSRDVFARTRLEVASGERGELFKASYDGTPRDIQLALCASGGDPRSATEDGMTALMWAAYNNPHTEVVKALLEAGARIDAQSHSGRTALMLACYYNSEPKVIEALLDAGADADIRDDDQIRAIDYLRWRRSMHDTDAMKRLDAATSHILDRQ